MRKATVPRSRSLRFMITPMIDIVFLLIIFFLVATHFVKSETLEPVELPEATQATDDEEALPHRIVITVNAEGVYYLGGREITQNELEGILLQSEQKEEGEEKEVRIRGDSAAVFAEIKPILLACAKAKIRKVSFTVVPKAE